MPLQVHQPAAPLADGDRLAYARQILRAEASALDLVGQRLDASFEQAVELIQHATHDGNGRVAISGTGKSADVGLKIAGTLNSTGTRAYVLDATKALHGDLGMLHPADVALILSHSGESEEILRLLTPLRTMVRGIVALTGQGHSTLARKADVAIVYGPLEEVCPLGLAPSASTTAMIALGDALAFVLSRAHDFTHEDFARFHPAGSLGRKLVKVDVVMRRDDDLRLAPATETVRTVFATARLRGRRTGAVMLIDDEGRLTGLFTDSDLARLIEARRDDALDRPIAEVMTPDPLTVSLGARVMEAVEILKRHKISELPVVDGDGRPIGMIDITDLIGIVDVERGRAARASDAASGFAGCGVEASNMKTLQQRCAAIELLVVDVDGVLTDGGITYTANGVEVKQFHVRDGTGLKCWEKAGKRAGLITGRSSPIVEQRAQEIGIAFVIQGAAEKLSALRGLLGETGVLPEQVCFVGDDLPDVPALRHSGLAVAVADASAEVRAEAHYVTQAVGGRGAVREVIELILRCQGRWQPLAA